MDLIAEFERLKLLFYVGIGLQIAVILAAVVGLCLLAPKLGPGQAVLKSYPVRVRLRAGLGRAGRWEHLVQEQHVPLLRNHRRTVGRIVGILCLVALLNLGFRLGIRALVARVQQIGDEAASRTYDNVCP